MAACTPSRPVQVSLGQSSQDYLEGVWAKHCGDDPPDPNEGFDPSFSIEFRRSGGSFYFSDGVDIDVRGKIISAERAGKDTRLVVFYGSGESVHDIWYLRPVAKDQLESRKDEQRGKPDIFKKCSAPDRKPVEKLSSRTVLNLTLAKRGGAFFVETDGKDASCKATPRSWARFDLIGPTRYSVGRWGESGGEWLTIAEASELGDEIVLTGSAEITNGEEWQNARKEARTIRVRWLDCERVYIQPWNAQFLRCSH